MREVVHLSRPQGAAPVEHDHAPVRTHTVYVVQTSTDETLAAVPVAAELARILQVPITVVDFRTVPNGAPPDALAGIHRGPIEPYIDRYRAQGFDVRLRVYLCRNERNAFPLAFDDRSMIVIAGRRGWWPRRAERWRRILEADGHFVMFVDMNARSRRETIHA